MANLDSYIRYSLFHNLGNHFLNINENEKAKTFCFLHNFRFVAFFAVFHLLEIYYHLAVIIVIIIIKPKMCLMHNSPNRYSATCFKVNCKRTWKRTQTERITEQQKQRQRQWRRQRQHRRCTEKTVILWCYIWLFRRRFVYFYCMQPILHSNSFKWDHSQSLCLPLLRAKQ